MPTGSSSNIQRNYETPISQLPSQINSSSFDDYVLVGKKGDQYTVYSSSDKETTSQLISEFTSEASSSTKTTESVG